MVTQKGTNTYVVGITGNFDDAQSGVKKIFGDETLRREMNAAGYQFSSANSINIGRLVPQIVYYVYAYAKLLAGGEITLDRVFQCDGSHRQFRQYSGCLLREAYGDPH